MKTDLKLSLRTDLKLTLNTDCNANIEVPDQKIFFYVMNMFDAQLMQVFFSFQMFGGSDPSQYKGSLYSTPIIKEWYYETVIVDVEVDHVSLNMDCKEVRYLIK